MDVTLDRQKFHLEKHYHEWYLMATKPEQTQLPRMQHLEGELSDQQGIPLSRLTPGEIVRLKKA